MSVRLMVVSFGIIVFTSCNSSNTEEKYVFKDSTGLTPPITTTVSTTAPQVIPANNSSPIQFNSSKQGTPVSLNTSALTQQKIPNNAMTTTVVNPATNVTPTAPGMNPPHGQPGHRCDIAVGAPLNSKPNPQPVVTKQPVQTVTTQQPAVLTPTAPGMNPPHGQPGHRCDIAVGAPLNSAPPKKDSSK